jgi:hypothetical protein
MKYQYVAFASFSVLIWDHIDTFGGEVGRSIVRVLTSRSEFANRWSTYGKERRAFVRKTPTLKVYDTHSGGSPFFQLCICSFWYVSHVLEYEVLRFAQQNRYFTPLGFILNFYGIGSFFSSQRSHH